MSSQSKNYVKVLESMNDFSRQNPRLVTKFYEMLAYEVRNREITLAEAMQISKLITKNVSKTYKPFYEKGYSQFLESVVTLKEEKSQFDEEIEEEDE